MSEKYFLENDEGVFRMSDGGACDDLDFAQLFDTYEEAEELRMSLPDFALWDVG